jgi:hypothetical protein
MQAAPAVVARYWVLQLVSHVVAVESQGHFITQPM